ncbi:MAG: hypothetical protein FJ255_01160 [Phycisphaerae bacterium]|nr:hypothetical protein [Phycisphaerae bacterium]
MTTRTRRPIAGQGICSLARRAALIALAGLAASASGQVEPQAGMLRWPAVSKTHVVFSYANDLWMVPKAGGVARPVAGPAGQESFARLSPDGSTIAFVGNYEGNRDLYTIPAEGGFATRVTHHPASETLCGWTNDGRLLFLTNGLAGLSRQSQLFTVSSKGGLPEQVPVPYGGFGSISPDGQWLTYTLHSTDNRTWKRYRGGMATDVWLFNLRDKSSRQITDWEGTDTIPMFNPADDGTKVYYLSDNGPEHRLNIWEFDTRSGRRSQITRHAVDDVRWPSIGPGDKDQGEIVFQLGAELRLLDLGTGQDRVVKVTIPGDRPSLRPRQVDAARFVGSAAISPAGKRVAIEARGDVWTAPAKEGVVRNLTRTPGVFERSPSWSPDGRWIAYFSDESGEYQLWIRPSDARAPEKEEKKDDKKDEKKEEKEGDAAAPPAEVKGLAAEPRRLTDLGPGFKTGATWSPDSKRIFFRDNFGRMYLVTVEPGADGTHEVRQFDKDPWSDAISVSWSHDSAWLAYDRSDDTLNQRSVWLHHVKSGQTTRVTSGAFPAGDPAFDNKGDFLYFVSNRNISGPMYSDLDTTWVYTGTANLLMVPLRADVKDPFALKADEETFKEDKKPDSDKKPADKKDDEKKGDARPDDGVSGTWEGTATGGNLQQPIPVSLIIRMQPDGSVSGTVVSPMGQGGISSGSFDKASGTLTLSVAIGDAVATITGVIKGEEISGSWSAGEMSGSWSGRRTGKPGAQPDAEKKDEPKKDDRKDEAKEVKIELEGFEERAVLLPVSAGSFGSLAVTHDHKLVYVRRGARGSGEASSIKIFDPADEAREEKTVTAGGGFQMSADRKKLLIGRGGSNLTIADAAAGGGKSSTVPTAGMNATIPDPRVEWRQIIHDVYKVQRDYFYEATLHGVDWAKIRDHYLKMVDDCVNREDLNHVIAEMISELNIGHAYVTSQGDVESGPGGAAVGLLGADFELVPAAGDAAAAYRVKKLYSGGPWDSDARNPVNSAGPAKDRIHEGEFITAVNGVPVDTAKDPWASFVGTANRPTTLTVSKNQPVPGKKDADARDVLVRPIASEGTQRYRAWIEANRKYVDEKSGGRVGYIYVPNTGTDGQSDLVRQFIGQRAKEALIIDERWNGGGQIPTRFIELLNRPAIAYWARRDLNDWTWPPDAHNGPKTMLINGLAGSGGDMFPWLFKLNGLGRLIGTRTWGGLVGISGNPGLIDGGYVSVPTFGIYERDGTWAVEGHGVDPDILVIDDPARMQNGQDPQLDAAIAHMLDELTKNPYVKPARPASPDRKGMGLDPKDK